MTEKLTEVQMSARNSLLQEKSKMLNLQKIEEGLIQNQLEELYDRDTRVKFNIQILEKEIKALEEMK